MNENFVTPAVDASLGSGTRGAAIARTGSGVVTGPCASRLAWAHASPIHGRSFMRASLTGRCVSRVHPTALLPALDRLLDEVHAACAVLHGREVRVELAGLVAGNVGRHRPRRVEVDVRERLDEGFRMPERQPRVVLHNR